MYMFSSHASYATSCDRSSWGCCSFVFILFQLSQTVCQIESNERFLPFSLSPTLLVPVTPGTDALALFFNFLLFVDASITVASVRLGYEFV